MNEGRRRREHKCRVRGERSAELPGKGGGEERDCRSLSSESE